MGGLGARPPPRSTPPPRQRWGCWRSWGKAATPLNTATLELAAVLSFPGGATPGNALRKDRPEPPLDSLLVPLASCGGDDCPQNLALLVNPGRRGGVARHADQALAALRRRRDTRRHADGGTLAHRLHLVRMADEVVAQRRVEVHREWHIGVE